MRFGVRAHDYGAGNIEWVAQQLKRHSVKYVQLAPAKSFTNIKTTPGQIRSKFASQVSKAFSDVGTNIAVLGCYINPVHPDPLQREISLRRFEEHLTFAKDFKCSIVATETGSNNADCTYHPNNQTEESLAELIGSVRRLAKTAEKFETFIGIEGVAHHHLVDTHDKMVTLLNEVNSDFVKVVYDPVNYYPMNLTKKQVTYIDDAFDKFGDQIVAIHCKDFKNDNGIKTGEFVSGEGDMDHEYLFTKLLQTNTDVPIILECTNQENITRAMEFVTKCKNKVSSNII